MSDGPVLDVCEVTKRYGALAAVDEVSLQVRPGEIYALLGLNGAGKTTLIRMVLGMIRPTLGSLRVLGRPTTDRTVWSQVGYLVEGPACYPELTVRENLEVVRRLRKVSEPGAVGEVIEVMELGAYAEQRARTLSLGNTQRLGLAKALLHRPTMLVLDEPVNALDPAGVAGVREMLRELSQQHGTTVLLSSHRLAEVARVADRIGVLHHGRLVQELDAGGLDRANRLHSHLEVAARDDTRAAQALHTAGLACRQGPHGLAIRDPWAVAHPDEVATTLVRAGIPPMHIGLVQEDLEAYFLRLVAQIVAVGGLLVFGMVSIWLFGREFSDGTLKDLLALPTSRSAVVLAKLIVGAGWCLALAAYVTVLSLAAGYLLGLPGWSAATAARGLGTIGLVAVLTIALTTAYGLVASIERGYLPAVGAMFATLFAAQVTAAVGYGEWFPWSVPSLLSGVAGEGQAAAGSLSLALVLIVGAAGALGTAVWWERADHDR